MVPKDRIGLGKGLEALITSTSAFEPTTPGLALIEVNDIEPNPRQPRSRIEPDTLHDLADSIREHGLIQPLVVTRKPGAGRPGTASYQLIAGERRWQAARMAGLERVPAMIKEATQQEMLELALVENIQRADLNPLEEALAYQHLVDEFGLTQEQVAARVGKHRVSVTNALRLLRLLEPVQRLLAEGSISEGHARALLALDSPEAQLKLAELVQQRGLSVRQTEEMVRRLSAPREAAPARPNASPDTLALEKSFRDALGTKVNLSRGRRGGRLVIYFYSEEELQSIFETIVARPGRDEA